LPPAALMVPALVWVAEAPLMVRSWSMAEIVPPAWLLMVAVMVREPGWLPAPTSALIWPVLVLVRLPPDTARVLDGGLPQQMPPLMLMVPELVSPAAADRLAL